MNHNKEVFDAMYEALKQALNCCDLRDGNTEAKVEDALAKANSWMSEMGQETTS